MAVGGHVPPISMVGVNLLWKNLQKKEKKNKTSETINKIIPHWRPVVTLTVWSPWNTPSRVTSRHHWTDDKTIKEIPMIKRFTNLRWNHFVKPVVNAIAPIEVVKGQGLFSTKW